MTECHSTKILVILKKELSLFDLVRDNDVFIWGQTTLKHLGGGWGGLFSLFPATTGKKNSMFGVSNYE